jgi:hypothetical protein
MEKYYKALTQEVFEEVKKASIERWGSYDDEFGYATGKINRIKDLENIRDNGMTMIAMFDPINQKLLKGILSAQANKEITERYADWEYIN